MARVKYSNFTVDTSGNTTSNTQVEVRRVSDSALATLYAASTEATEAYSGSNPFNAGDGSPDSIGWFEFWVDPDIYDITVGTGGSAVTYRVDLGHTKAPIFIVAAGQSNIASSNSQAAGGTLTTDDNILYYNGSAWVTFDPDSGVGVGASGYNSIAFQMAREARAEGHTKVYCVVNGHAGDAIDQWVGSGTSSTNYVSLKSAVEGGLAADGPAADGITQVTYFLWGQGESDGASDFDASSYATDFDTLKTQLRAESWFAETTPIVCLEMPGWDAENVYQTPNRFFVDWLPYDEDPYAWTVRTRGLDDGADNIHWTGAAMDEVGARAYHTAVNGVVGAQRIPDRFRLDTPLFEMDPANGKGLMFKYDSGTDAVTIGTASRSTKPSFAGPILTFDIDGDTITADQTFIVNGTAQVDFLKIDSAVSNAGIHTEATTGALNLGGGTNAVNSGANLTLYGSAHASLPGDIRMRSDTALVYWWDESASTHYWYNGAGSAIMALDGSENLGIGTITPDELLHVDGIAQVDFLQIDYAVANAGIHTNSASGALRLGGGVNAANDGVNMTLQGSGGSFAGDVKIRNGTQNIYQWDDSADWHIWYDNSGATHMVLTANELRPGGDNVTALGSSGVRWEEVFAGTGTINTSDAREKTTVIPLSNEELEVAAELSREIGKFQFLTSVEKKGEKLARQHTGMTVQRAVELMEEKGLNPFAHGFICYDEWDEIPEVPDEYDEEGNLIQTGVPGIPAGDRYGFRADQLALFMIASLRAEVDSLRAELKKILKK